VASEKVDWDGLRAAARQVAANAHAPYSGLHVGVEGVTDSGQVVTGCNVENASYGLTLCAECGLVSDLHRSGGGRLVAVAVRTDEDEPLMPCGRCRQLLLEAGGPDLLIDGSGEPRLLSELLPAAFDSSHLPPAPEGG
jgi:cytidine deaminase